MLSHRTVFNEYIVPATMETFAEQVRLFNEASNGAIVLDAANFRGDFVQQAFFDSLIGAQRRVDRYTPNTAVTQTEIKDHTQTGVKVAGGFGPIVYEPTTMTWLNEPTARGIEIASRNFADALLYDQVNTALNATIAAISGNAAAVYGTTTEELTYDVINMAHARFGAASGSIIVDVMNGLQYHKFISKNLTNANSLFSAGNVQVVDILGKKVVVNTKPGIRASIHINNRLFAKRRVADNNIEEFRWNVVVLESCCLGNFCLRVQSGNKSAGQRIKLNALEI